MTRGQVTRPFWWAMRPVMNWRGRIVSRTFRELDDHPRFYDRPVRAAIEWVCDRVEMWEMKPNFDRMERQLEECERIARDLEDIRNKYGLSDERRMPQARTEESK